MHRIKLPNRRMSRIYEFQHNGVWFTGQVSWSQAAPDEAHQAVEFFLDGGRPGTAIQSVARDTAVAASLAIQYGTPIETLQNALTRNDDGSPSGPLGALLDLIEADHD